MSETCETCRFWKRMRKLPSDPLNPGLCRIRSPEKNFPIREEHEWCGEHEPAKPEFRTDLDGDLLPKRGESPLAGVSWPMYGLNGTVPNKP